jgi:hypothetical protein
MSNDLVSAHLIYLGRYLDRYYSTLGDYAMMSNSKSNVGYNLYYRRVVDLADIGNTTVDAARSKHLLYE